MSSILDDTKKILGIDPDYTVFDLDVLTHINATFSVLTQLGVGPEEGFFITDNSDEWSDFDIPDTWLNLVRTYIYLKVRMLFDPPSLSFMLTAAEEQIKEYEWRLNMFREVEVDLDA